MRLEMKDHAFWLNGEPHFFYGGEIHYFRIDPQQWRARLLSAQDMGVSTISTYIPWIWHEPESGHYDFDGRTHAQRNLLNFLELSDDIGLSVFIRPGPYVMSELRHEGLPDWLLAQHPEIIARGAGGQEHPTQMVSYMHPVFLEHVGRWYAALSQALMPYFHQNGGPVILTQLDNEVGMLHWVSGMPDSAEAQRSPVPDHGEGPYWQAEVFWREYRARYLNWLAGQARAGAFPGPYVINVHGFRDFSIYSRGVDYPIGLSQLARAASIPDTLLGGDFYPGHVTYDNFHDLALAVTYTRSANRADAAAISPEFQSGRFQDRPAIEPSDLDLAARVSVSYGLNGLNWYMLAGGENPGNIGLFGRRHDWQAPLGPAGDRRASAQAVSHLGALFRSYGPALAASQPAADLHIGYYSAYYLTENSVRDQPADVQRIVEEIVSERESLHFDGIYRILIAANITVSAVAIDKNGDDLDPADFPYLWVAATRYMDARTQTRLAAYALSGGTLILGPRIPEQDLEGMPCRILAEALDLPAARYGTRGLAQVLEWDEVFCPAYATFPEKPGCEVMGRLTAGDAPGEAVILRQPAGQGVVVLMGLGLPDLYQYYHATIRTLIAALGCTPRLHVSNPAIHATVRTGSRGSFLFVHNFHEGEQDALITFQGPAAETDTPVWKLHIAPRQGLMLPFDGVSLWPGGVSILSTTSEITGDSGSRQATIHRTDAAGEALLQTTAGESSLTIISGTARLHTDGPVIRIHWDEEERSTPLVLDIVRTDSIRDARRPEVSDRS